MESSLECEVCFSEYDSKEHRPKFLPCGHTLCDSCIRDNLLAANGKMNCPFCRTPCGTQVKTFKDFPTAFALLNLIDNGEQNSSPETVSQRGKDKEILNQKKQTESHQTESQIISCSEYLLKLRSAEERQELVINNIILEKRKLLEDYQNSQKRLEEEEKKAKSIKLQLEDVDAEGNDIVKGLEGIRDRVASTSSLLGFNMASQDAQRYYTASHDWVSSKVNSILQEEANMKPKVAHQKKKVFILNNFNFSVQTLQKREGAEIDSSNLRSTFISIGYDDNDVHIHENLTAADTDHVLDQIQQDTSLDFLLLMILSRGKNTDTFFTSDGQEYSLKSIQARFTDDACPHLKDKAKVIMCNYKRGMHQITDNDIYSEDTVYNNRKVPITRHMITIHSSREGCISWRFFKKGSVFVTALCEVLREKPNISIIEAYNLIEEKIREVYDKQLPEMKISSPIPQFNF